MNVTHVWMYVCGDAVSRSCSPSLFSPGRELCHVSCACRCPLSLWVLWFSSCYIVAALKDIFNASFLGRFLHWFQVLSYVKVNPRGWWELTEVFARVSGPWGQVYFVNMRWELCALTQQVEQEKKCLWKEVKVTEKKFFSAGFSGTQSLWIWIHGTVFPKSEPRFRFLTASKTLLLVIIFQWEK